MGITFMTRLSNIQYSAHKNTSRGSFLRNEISTALLQKKIQHLKSYSTDTLPLATCASTVYTPGEARVRTAPEQSRQAPPRHTASPEARRYNNVARLQAPVVQC
jgi:hypothetical protein